MSPQGLPRPRFQGLGDNPVDIAAYGAIAALGVLAFWLAQTHPSAMPFWAPWDFSPATYLATALGLFWYCRGLARTPAGARPVLWRRGLFLAGVLLTYAVLQTRIEYWSQHMFFLNRLQAMAMHEFGPFLIALAWPWPTIKAGLPRTLRAAFANAPAKVVLRALHHPLTAGFLFLAGFYLWLVPVVHFRAMIDHQLYAVMNASMVIGGLLFWSLVLDPRPKPPAPASFAARVALAIGIMPPQMLIGALISFMPRDIYPNYDLCGRLFPAIDAISDQHIGGIISWVPSSMMSVIAVPLILNFLRLQQEAETKTDNAQDRVAEHRIEILRAHRTIGG